MNTLASLSLILSLLISGPSFAQNEMLVLENKSSGSDRIQVGILNQGEVSESEFDKALAQIPEDKDLLVSTDSPNVAKKIYARIKAKGSGLRQLLPLGALKERPAQLVKAAKANKIGLTIVTITTAYDSYLWAHATEYSSEVRAAQIIFSTLMAITFSIDTNTWARVSRGLNGKILNIFSSAKLNKIKNSKYFQFGTLFGANMAMSMSIQGARLSILSYDHTVDLRYVVTMMGTATAVAGVATVAGIGWGEFSADIDAAKNPYAKFMVRRFNEAKSLFNARFASSSQVLQPGVYGYQPWVILTVGGAAGMIAMIKGKGITENLENFGKNIVEFSFTDAVDKWPLEFQR